MGSCSIFQRPDPEIIQRCVFVVSFRDHYVYPHLWYGGVEHVHLMAIVDPVRETLNHFFHIFLIFDFLETSDHEILPGEGLQHRHLLLVRLLVCWEIHSFLLLV